MMLKGSFVRHRNGQLLGELIVCPWGHSIGAQIQGMGESGCIQQWLNDGGKHQCVIKDGEVGCDADQ